MNLGLSSKNIISSSFFELVANSQAQVFFSQFLYLVLGKFEVKNIKIFFQVFPLSSLRYDCMASVETPS